MKIATLGLLAAFGAGCIGPVLAGDNAGGFLLLHTDDSVIYTTDDDPATYCELLAAECPWDPECDDDPSVCVDWVVNDLNHTSGLGGDAALIWVIAAFPTLSCPNVTAVQFGFSWDISLPSSPILDFGECGPFALATDSWPHELNSGVAVSWGQGSGVQRHAFPVYWFAAYGYYGALEIGIGEYPTSEGTTFADGSIPPVLDPINQAHRGSVGLNGATGSSPFDPVPTVETSWGAVKAIFGR